VRKPGEAGRPPWFWSRTSRGGRRPSAERKRKNQSAFTLLEVLVAIAILGLGLTVILSSQAGLFSSASRGEHLTVASNLLRCKMSEVELEMEQKGFQLTDENDEGPCCDDESEGYSCAWKIERVELPPLPADSGTEGGDAGPGDAPPTGPLDMLANLSQNPSGAMGEGGPGGMMEQLSGGGMESMVMGFVYPSLKPMLEASIRRVTVKVTWKEGARERELEVTQFLTRPQDGELGTAEQLGLTPAPGSSGGSVIPGLTGTGTGTGTGTTRGGKVR
jgi:general secretion pathway protein I